MSITPPKSLMTAVGVKNKPSAIIFRLSSMLMKITKTYSAIWNGPKHIGHRTGTITGQGFSWGWVAVPARWAHAWLFERGIRTSWKCKSRWWRWSWPSPGRWPIPADRCQRANNKRHTHSRKVCCDPLPCLAFVSYTIPTIYFIALSYWSKEIKGGFDIFMQHKIVHEDFKCAGIVGFVMLTKADDTLYSSQLLWQGPF